MKKIVFKGSGVALVTPMNDDGSVNFEALGEIIEFQIKNKTDAIITCGTTGESATMNDDERSAGIKFTVEKVAGRVPVIAGTGSNNTEHALKMSQKAQELGVDALLIVTPYYNKTSQKGLITHYNYIADNVDLPIIFYNVPSRTGVSIKPETYLELSKHPNIVATKEASGDISAIAKMIALCGDNLAVYSTQMFVHTNFRNLLDKTGVELSNNTFVGTYGQRFGAYGYNVGNKEVAFTDELDTYLEKFAKTKNTYYYVK